MKDITVFDDTKLSDLLREIHTNTKNKQSEIDNVVKTLIPYIKSADDAIMLAPIIREFYDVAIRNDDHVIKMATIVQRLLSAESYSSQGSDPNDILSDEEKETLMRNALRSTNEDVNELIKSSKEVDADFKNLTKSDA